MVVINMKYLILEYVSIDNTLQISNGKTYPELGYVFPLWNTYKYVFVTTLNSTLHWRLIGDETAKNFVYFV